MLRFFIFISISLCQIKAFASLDTIEFQVSKGEELSRTLSLGVGFDVVKPFYHHISFSRMSEEIDDEEFSVKSFSFYNSFQMSQKNRVEFSLKRWGDLEGILVTGLELGFHRSNRAGYSLFISIERNKMKVDLPDSVFFSQDIYGDYFRLFHLEFGVPVSDLHIIQFYGSISKYERDYSFMSSTAASVLFSEVQVDSVGLLAKDFYSLRWRSFWEWGENRLSLSYARAEVEPIPVLSISNVLNYEVNRSYDFELSFSLAGSKLDDESDDVSVNRYIGIGIVYKN